MGKQVTIIMESCCMAEHSEYRRYTFRETLGEYVKNGAFKSFNPAKAIISRNSIPHVLLRVYISE